MLKPETPAEAAGVVCHRILRAQGLSLVAALFCVVDTRLSIALIVLLQLYYAVAPGFRSAS